MGASTWWCASPTTARASRPPRWRTAQSGSTDDSARTGRLGPGAHHGLGLAIADEVVRAHGGTLALSNAEGSGAVATLRLPLGPRAGAAWPRVA